MPKYAPVPTTTLGDRIREARGEMSQADLAERLGVDSITVSRWERGVVRPSADNVLALCQVLGLTLSDFTGEAA